MLQRIQSIYLFLGGLCLLAVVLFPVLAFEGAERSFALSMCSFSDGTEKLAIPSLYWVWLGVAWLGGILMIINVFGYNNRKSQMQKGRLTYLLILGVIVLAAVMTGAAEESLPAGEWATVYHISFYLPAAALALNFLANRSIKNDEDLVKSLDRLR